ncbi:hypothetical protein TIFTF001_014127 [Ficus carica]|uniref:Protein PAIR1 n=1 Tax=Ficus carica TaxID=3494 RepID=A0AA87ZW76_FICCA|nr:hypothetical protein TIFTF001_014127 [Ficus carica]
MKLKINKASDLNSISVLPPQARLRGFILESRLMIFFEYVSRIVPVLVVKLLRARIKNVGPYAHGPQTSQLRSQVSQQSMSQVSSQHGVFSQFSQNSFDEAPTNDQRSQERENPVKKTLCLPPTCHTREESQMHISRSSTNLMRKWNSASLSDNRCQTSEELEHRIGIMETSLNRFGMILDSIQSDVMQVNKGTKEVPMETEGLRQKLEVQDNTLQLMNKGQEDIKSSLDGGFKSITEQLSKHTYQDKFRELLLVLSALPEKIEASIQKSLNELHNSFTKEIQAIACRLVIPDRKDRVTAILQPKVSSCSSPEEKPRPIMNSAVPPKVCVQETVVPKIETGGWKSVKSNKSASTHNASNKMPKQKGVYSIQKGRECRVIIESDEELDGDFSCLLKENAAGTW